MQEYSRFEESDRQRALRVPRDARLGDHRETPGGHVAIGTKAAHLRAYGNFHQLPGTRWWFQLGLSTPSTSTSSVHTQGREHVHDKRQRRPFARAVRAHKIVRGLLCLSAADQLDKCVPGRTAVDSASVLSCGLEATTNALISVFEHRTRFSGSNPCQNCASEASLACLQGAFPKLLFGWKTSCTDCFNP